MRHVDEAGLVTRIQGLPPASVVAVSGFGGAGKSTLTKALVDAVPNSARLRGDDFLDPVRSHRRSHTWDGMERDRMRAEVLEPFRRGEPVVYRRFDWDAHELGPPTSLPPCDVLLVDSIGILHPDLDGCFDLRVWVDTPLEIAAQRGIRRDREAGHDHDRLWSDVWVPNDRDFAEQFDPRSAADLLFAP